MQRPTSRASASAERQVAGFIAKFSPPHQRLIKAVRKALRARLPTATEIVYDNYNFFVIAYGPSERASECILSIAAGASGVGLCFLYGATLPDPHKLLLGAGNQTRFIRLESIEVFARPEVEALIAAAAARAKSPFRKSGRGPLIVKSVSAKQRPRRKG